MDKDYEESGVAVAQGEQAGSDIGTLGSVIGACCDELSALGVEFDADDVVERVVARSPELIRQRGDLLVRNAIRKLVRDMLRRSSGLNDDEDGEQISIEGVGDVPRNLPFVSEGGKVKHLNTHFATEQHIVSSLELSETNIKRCLFRRDQKLRLLDFLRHSGKNTVGEALHGS